MKLPQTLCACIIILNLLFLSCFNREGTETCFVGDSLVQLWDVQNYFPDLYIHKYGVGGAKLSDLANWDLSECAGNTVVLLIGTNDLSSIMGKDSSLLSSYVNRYCKQVDKIQASRVIAISILPRKKSSANSTSINNFIKIVNERLRKEIYAYDSTYIFLDVQSLFMNGDDIISEYFRDGVHLTQSGYDLLSDRLRRVL